jgi:Ser/Thr protein kinase RdoA (MazF antagonist)
MELFQPNNLSVLKPQFTPISNSVLTAEISSALENAYSLSNSDTIRLSQSVGANVASQNLLVEVGSNRYFVKRRPANQKNRLADEAKLAVDLLALDMRVPRVIRTKEGTLVHGEDEWCCAVYSFEEGYYFSGRGNELDSAAESFGRLSRAAQKLFAASDETSVRADDQFLDELGPLMEEAAKSAEPKVSDISRKHLRVVVDSLDKVGPCRTKIQSDVLPLHLDYHPLNLLVRDHQIACILDFEHLKFYPVSVGLGFAGYKLIRQALVHEDIRAAEYSKPTLVYRWLEGWRESFPNHSVSLEELTLGARYRVLFLVHLILAAFLQNNDDRFLYDLEKQIISLYEIDAMTRLYG